MSRPFLVGLAGLAALGVLVACGGRDQDRVEPYSPEDVQRAFQREGIQLVERSLSPEADAWGILLVPTDDRLRVEIQVYADGKTAKNLGGAFDDFQPPGKARHFDLTREANVLAVAERNASPETRRRVERAFRQLSSD